MQTFAHGLLPPPSLRSRSSRWEKTLVIVMMMITKITMMSYAILLLRQKSDTYNLQYCDSDDVLCHNAWHVSI